MFLSSYRKKLIGLFIIIAMVPIVLFTFSVYSIINTYVIEENIKNISTAIENEAETLEIWFRSNEEKLKDISVNYPFFKEFMLQEGFESKINEILSSQFSSINELQNLRLVFDDNRLYSATETQNIGDPRKYDEYVNAVSSGELVWTLKDTDNPEIITASIPLYSSNGEVEGVLLADFSYKAILNKFNQINTQDGSTSYILNDQGEILNEFGEKITESQNDQQSYEKVLQSLISQIMISDIEGDNTEFGGKYLAFYSTIPSVNWKILSVIPKSNIYKSNNVLFSNVIYISTITLLLIFILAMSFSRVFSEPLLKLKTGAIEIQKGNYDYKFEIKKEDEFGQVADAFNNMALRLKESYIDINNKNSKLTDANKKLQQINLELESSYDQLKITTDKLNESEQRFRTLLGNLDDLVWIMDNNLNITFANDKVESVLNVSKDYFVGRNLDELVQYICNDREAFRQDFIDTDLKNREINITNKTEKKLTVEINTKRVYENGELIAIHGVIRNVTERKKMEENLIRRNEELIVINRVSRGLTSAMNMETLMQRAVDAIIRLMNTSLCTIRLLEKDRFVLKASAGETSRLVTAEDISIEEDYIGKVASTGKVQVLEVENDHNKSEYLADLANSSEIKYLNILPIKARGKMAGIMIVGSKEKLGKGEFNVLASIANQIALITENISLYQGLKNNYFKTIETLAAAIEAKDEYTEGHSNRVAKYAFEIAKYIGMPKKFCEDIKIAGILHDVGKIGIKDGVLGKPGRLTEEEYEMIRRHPIIGSQILESVGFSDVIMNAIKFHHKRYDLKGYPQEIYIEDLPLEAAIIGVADAFDAMTTSRSYRSAITIDEAITELIRNKGTQFNPYIVEIMVDIYNKDPELIESIIESDNIIENTSLA